MVALIADPREVGRFIDPSSIEADRLGFLMPNNWVFHDQIADCVRRGDYRGIRPVCSEFDATLNCSNRCTECAYKFVKEREGVWGLNEFSRQEFHMPDLEFAVRLVDKLKSGGIKGLIFTGGGEPFYFRHLEEVIKHATDIGMDSAFYTNGNALSEARVRRLVEAGPLMGRVSLNAGTEAVYNAFHDPFNPKGALQRTLRTIEALARGSRENPRMSVGVGVVINQINQDDLVEAALRIREIVDRTKGGIEFVAYRPQFDYYGPNQLPADLLDKTHEIVERDVRKVLQGTGVSVQNVHCRYEALKKNTRNYTRCMASGICAETTCMGQFLCCDRNFDRNYRIGDLSKESLSEIYSGDQREALIDYIDSTSCGVCPLACRSHETNRQFQRVEELRAEGRMAEVNSWIDSQRAMPKPKMVNFP